MEGGWNTAPLGDVVQLQRGFDLPTSRRVVGRVPVIGSAGVTGRHCEAKVKGPGVVTGRYGTVGRVFFIEEDYWPLNTSLFVRDFKDADPRFVYYLLQTLDFGALSAKSAVPGIDRNDLHEVEVPVPPPHEQRRIARILHAFDAKIGHNQLMRQRLETAARLMVRLKTETVSATKSIYDYATVTYGAAFKSALFDGEGTPVLRIRDLETQQPSVRTTEEHPKARLISAGDIVVGMDGEFRAHIWGGPEALLNQRLCVVDPLPGVARAFVLESLRRPLAFVEATETGTTVIHLGKADIDQFEFPSVAPDAMEELAAHADPLLAISASLGAESRRLAAVRDLLLPRLVSGRARVQANSTLAQDEDLTAAAAGA